jgi:hypothetical protein
MGKLSPEDAASFSNDENILTICVFPDQSTGDTEVDIATGKSIALPFNKSVLSEYKMGTGAQYIIVMFGDSYILPRDEKLAKAQAAKNKKLSARKTPAKLRQELTSKANAKKAALLSTGVDLRNNAAKTAGELEQVARLAKAAGFEGDVTTDPKAAVEAIKAYNTKYKNMIKNLDPGEKKFYLKAVNLYAKGTAEGKRKANAILAELAIPELNDLARSGVKNLRPDVVTAERKKALNAKIREISAANEKLAAIVANPKSSKEKADTAFKIRANIAKVKELKARIAMLGDIKITTIRNKAKMLADVQAQIEANLGKGMEIDQALQAALAKLPVDEDTKQQVREQIIEQVADGMPTQYAVQQSIQNIAVEQEIPVEDEIVADDLDLDLDIPGVGTDDDDLDIDALDLDDPNLGLGETAENFDDASALAGSASIQDILANL